MPYSYPNNVPTVAKNKSAKEQKACVSAANDALNRGKSEQDAIFACIGAMKNVAKKKQESDMPDEIELGAKENAAQQSRSKRYGIQIRDDGNITKPGKWAHLSDSQFGDPVNYLYPIADKAHAVNAKARFQQNKGKYNSSSQAKVRQRINRLCRKYGVDPLGNDSEQENTFDNIFIPGDIMLQNDGEIAEDDPHKGMVRIPAARQANLSRRVWFWLEKITLDQDLFESFIDNWQSDVVGNELFIADGHQHNREALAWVKDIQVEDGDLVLYAESTPMGEGRLGETYKYASLWFTDNFRDQETGIEYGPTLLGCAATNIPFVHRMEPMSFVMSNFPQYPQQQTGNVNNYFFTTSTLTEDNVTSTQVTEEDGSPENPEGGNEMPEDTAPQGLQVGDRVWTASDIEGLVGQLHQSTTEQAKLKQQLQEARVSELCDKASGRGVAPVVIQVAREILMACDMTADASIELSDPEKPAEQTKQKVNLFNAVAKLMGVVPGRIGDRQEVTYTHHSDQPPAERQYTNPHTADDDLTPEEAEEEARQARKNLGIAADSGEAEL